MYRVGIIGCGRISCELPDNHMKAYQGCPDTELVTMCDIDIEQMPSGYTGYTDYLDMVKTQNLDIVSVCTPPETHCKIVCDIAPYVKAIYCEKPIALTLEDADKMIEICDKHKVILQINHQRRFTSPVFRFSRGILNTGTHMFDLLRQLFGELVGWEYYGNELRYAVFSKAKVRIEEIDTDEPIFEFDCTHNKEPMLLNGVNHLLYCLENKCQSISSGREAQKTLELVLKYRELREV